MLFYAFNALRDEESGTSDTVENKHPIYKKCIKQIRLEVEFQEHHFCYFKHPLIHRSIPLKPVNNKLSIANCIKDITNRKEA